MKVKYGKSSDGIKISPIESYLISDYDWFNTVFEQVTKYLKCNKYEEEIDLRNFYNIIM